MVIAVIGNKLRSLVLLLIGVLRRALCCIQRRRRMSFDEPLTDIGVVKADSEEGAMWNDWDDDRTNRKPSTVQEHIEFYRQQKAQLQKQQEEVVGEQNDFFEDMAPAITRQKKIFVDETQRQDQAGKSNAFVPDAVSMGNELGEWDENPGWEGEELDWDATQALKEKKRRDRERRFAEQQQKRVERSSKPLGIKITS